MSEDIALAMAVEAVPIDALVQDPANVRLHPDRNVEAVKASLRKFGQRKPIVVQRDGMVIRAGNCTWQAAKALGWTKIAAVVCDDDDVVATAFAIADNRTAELAEWDVEGLRALVDGLDAELQAVAGFTAEELEQLQREFEQLNGQDVSEVEEDEAPEPPADPVTKPGDLWELGRHRVLCGDWRGYNKQLGHVDAVFVDPPYNVALGTKSANFSKRQRGYQSSEDDMSAEQYAQWIDALARLCRDLGETVIATPGNANQHLWPKPRWTLAWTKKNGQTRSPLTRGQRMTFACWEPVLVYGKLDTPPQSDVVDCSIAQDPNAEGHPCPKPLRLLVQILNWLAPEKAVMDPCAGSGTTLIAAEQIDRTCYGIEIEPRYCDVIVERWQNFTGEKAKRVAARVTT